MIKTIKRVVPVTLSFLPLLAAAQQVTNFSDVDSSFQSIIDIINVYIIPILVGIAVVYFMLGVLKYVRAGGDETARTEGRHMMIFGIIAIAVMVSIWGLVNFLRNSFGLSGDQTLQGGLPQVPRQ